MRGRRPLIREGSRRKHRPDYWLPLIATGLLAIGLVVVYAISPGVSILKGVSEAYYVSKQLIAIGFGVVAFIALSRIPYKWWRQMVRPLIYASIAAAIAVMAFGSEVNGAYRWVQIGGMSFQAAELIKFTLLIWLADLLARRKQGGELGDETRTIKPIAIAIVAIGVIVAGLQSDLGSTVVMVGMVATMMYIAGVPFKRLIKLGGIALIGLVLLVSTSAYRRQRLLTFIHPAADCQSAGYQSCQALIAVGSGGMFGLGLGKSIQAYGYLPEAANDSIFAILAEKFGFFGITLILAAYAVFFKRLSRIVERAPDDFSGYLVTGILAWFSVQAAINIGAMIGLLPLKGITLPFVSYGGTSLLFVTGALGLAFQISRYSAYAGTSNNTGDARDENTPYRRGLGRSYNTASGRRT